MKWDGRRAAGVAWSSGPTASRKDVITDDPVREARAAVIAAWQERFKIDTEVTVKDIMHFNAEDVKSALMDIEGGGKSSNAIAYKLKSFEGVIINGMYIEKRPGEHNTRTAWILRRHGKPDTPTKPCDPPPEYASDYVIFGDDAMPAADSDLDFING